MVLISDDHCMPSSSDIHVECPLVDEFIVWLWFGLVLMQVLNRII